MLSNVVETIIPHFITVNTPGVYVCACVYDVIVDIIHVIKCDPKSNTHKMLLSYCGLEIWWKYALQIVPMWLSIIFTLIYIENALLKIASHLKPFLAMLIAPTHFAFEHVIHYYLLQKSCVWAESFYRF